MQASKMGEYALVDGLIQQERPVYRHSSRAPPTYLHLATTGVWTIGTVLNGTRGFVHSTPARLWLACPTDVVAWRVAINGAWDDSFIVNVTRISAGESTPILRA